MYRATLKSIRGHIGRTIATAAAVIIGISFLAGTLIFTDSVQRAFDNLFATVFETTDAQVRSSEVVDAGFGIQVRSRIDESLVDDVAAVDGVSGVDGFVQGTATVVGNDGEPIGNPGQGPPTFGFSWTEDDQLSQFNVIDGREPVGPGEVVLDENTATTGTLQVGEQVQILSSAGSERFELVGIARFGTSNSIGGASSALFELSEAQRVLGAEGTLDAIGVRADEGIDEADIAARIGEILPAGAEVITGSEATEEAQSAIADGLSFFNIFLTAFAVIAIFVSAFVIANTFSILIAQRTRELALFRALGAARGQILRSVILEAVVIGVVGSLLGVLFGAALSYALQALLRLAGLELPSEGLVLLPRTVIVSLVIGTIVTVGSALFPAIRAARITPIEALREASAETWKRNNIRLAIGLVVTALGGVSILFGLLAPEIALAGLGAGFMFIGVFVLGPTIAKPVARVLGAPIAAFRGTTGNLARDNSMRNPKRTARTASALTIGVALVAGVTVLAASLKSSIEGTVAENFAGDVVIDSGSFGPGGGFSPQLAADVEALDEVDVATSLRVGVGEVEGSGDFIIAVEPVAFEILDVGIVEGSPTDLVGETIMLLDNNAEDLGVGIGDSIAVQFTDGIDRDLTVVGIYEDASFAGNQLVGQDLYQSTAAEQLDFAAYVRLADGVDIEDGRAAIDSVTAAYPNAEVQDRQEFIDSQSAQLDNILNLIFGLLGLAIIIAAFGIANTLRLSTIERTREIGLLRAVGMTRSQVRSTVRWEAVITALFGAMLGVALGLFFGYAIVLALRDQGEISLTIPFRALTTVVILAAIVGLLASIIPSIRASRLNILAAISSGQ